MFVYDEHQRLSHMACDKIKDYIVSNQLKAGDQLPTERDLAEQLEVSRPVVREALGTLEWVGLVSKRQGKGIFLQDPNFIALFHEMMNMWQRDSQVIKQVLQFRMLLEQAGVASIIQHAQAEDYDRLLNLIDQSERAETTVSEFIQLDYLFHQELLQLTGNALFAQLTDVVNHYFRWLKENKLQSSVKSDIPKTIKEHREIVESLKKQDEKSAKKWIERHLTKGIYG